MLSSVVRLSDRLLARFAPKIDAAAHCGYHWSTCYCTGGLRYGRRCMTSCSQVPNHCYACQVVGSC